MKGGQARNKRGLIIGHFKFEKDFQVDMFNRESDYKGL